MKKKSLIILIIVLLLVILAGGFAYAYFFTDMFKSKKDLFLKYISQNSEIVESLKDEEFKAYIEKQKTTPYTTSGSIKTNLTVENNTLENIHQDGSLQENSPQEGALQDSSVQDNPYQQILNDLQKCSITFEGNVDKANNYNYQNVRANYSDAQSISFEIAQQNDIYGLKINDVLNRFVGIENNNLKALATKLGVNEQSLNQIPDKIDFNQLKSSDIITEEKKTQLSEKISQIIENDLNSDMFVEEDAEGGIAYVLTLNKEDYVKIIKELLTTICEGENIFSETFTVDDFVNEVITDENKIEVKVYVKNRKLTKTQLTILDENLNEIANISLTKLENGVTIELTTSNDKKAYSISVQKEKTANNIKYYLEAVVAAEKVFDITMNFSGINTNEVQENSDFNIFVVGEILNSLRVSGLAQGSDMKALLYTYNNKKTFVSSVEKQDIASNVMTLNTAPNAEAIQNLFKQVGTRLEQINTQKMQAAGIQSIKNPFIYYIPAIVPVGATIAIQSPECAGIPKAFATSSLITLYGDNLVLERTQESNETTEEADKRLTQSTEENSNNGTEQSQNNTETQTFNSTWEVYAGKNISASSIRTLVSSAISNNQTSEHKVTVNGELPTAMPDLDSTKTYAVTLTYDTSGYVNGIAYTLDNPNTNNSANEITTNTAE